MKKGLWNLIGKVPVLVLAVAVGPVAMADGPMVPSGTATPPATPGQSGPIQTIAMDTNSYDTNMVPPAAPAPVAAPAARLRSGLPTGLLVAALRRALAVPRGAARSRGRRINGATLDSASARASTR